MADIFRFYIESLRLEFSSIIRANSEFSRDVLEFTEIFRVFKNFEIPLLDIHLQKSAPLTSSREMTYFSWTSRHAVGEQIHPAEKNPLLPSAS